MNRGVRIAEKAGIGEKSARAAARLELLGGFRLSAGGRVVDISARKSRALIGILALSPGLQATRERLTGLLWDDRGEEQARGSLRQALAGLRRDFAALGLEALSLPGDRVVLDPDAVNIDVLEFLSASAGTEASDHNTAAALYRGSFLDGLGDVGEAFDSWLREAHADLSGRAIKVLSALAASLHSVERVAAAERLVALDPLREASHLALMEAHIANGDRALALKQYESCALLLKRELGVEPGSALREMRQALNDAPQEKTTAVPVAVMDRKPAIAIMPFENMSGAAEHDSFCDGMTEDIITELSRFRTLRVISRNSSFQYRGAKQDVRRIGHELGARYILEGSMRLLGNRVRITGQLIDAQTGAHVWANRYDKDLVDVFATQDAITQEIVNTISVRLEDDRLEQSRTKPPGNISAFEWYLRGKHAFSRLDLDGMDQAMEAFQKAIACDPHYARAISYLGYTINMRTSFAGWGVSLDEPHTHALDLARQAAELDPTDNMAEIVLGWCRMFRRQYGVAQKHFERAIALNPNDSEALRVVVWYYAYTGQHTEAEALLAHIRELDPMLPRLYDEVLCAACILSGRYEEAIAVAESLPVDTWPEWPGWTAVAYAHAGRVEQARELGAAFRRNLKERWRGNPNAGDAEMTHWFFMDNPIQHDSDIMRFKDAWRIAGLDV